MKVKTNLRAGSGGGGGGGGGGGASGAGHNTPGDNSPVYVPPVSRCVGI